MRKLPLEFLLRFAENILNVRLGNKHNKKLVKPLMAGLYVTMKCNFRCTYCDDGSGNMYPHLPETRLDTAKTIQVLEIIRKASPGLNITGGEPSVRPDIDEIFTHIGRLGFSPVSFNTNAFLLDKHLSILDHVDYLIISLDSPNPQRGDALIDVGAGGQTERVIRNIKLARKYREAKKLKFDVIINSVIFPETIDDAWDVFEFSIKNDFYWNPMPYVTGKYPCPGLVDNPRWCGLIDEAMRVKSLGARVYGNMEVLRTIRDFKRFECYPTTHPIIYPNGDIFYPCAPLNSIAGNLLEVGSYDRAMKAGEEKYGPIPYCDSRCHIGCYTQGSTAITNPKEGIAEAWRFLSPRSTKASFLRRPPREIATMTPPSFKDLRDLPSIPPDLTRKLRREGRLNNDYTSLLRIDGNTVTDLIQLTKA
ncbi:MAG TPA: radical SAM protein [Blastocatellia bacterium]|jgi:MoaA/NifB/PqqE/SkfB family radical SAM enzyme|nr:radical SAM protein [Blastocatellia bacterium]